MERAFRLIRTLGQWICLLALGLVALGLAGGLLSIFHRPSPFLIDLGILGLPVIFVGLVFLFAAALLQRILLRRSARS
jgi:polyferredoxin